MTDEGGRFASVRARLPIIAVVVACVAGVVAAVTGAANPVSAVQFLLPGHWVYNAALQSVFHVDGSTGGVDAQARVPGSQGDQVFQGDTSGYVVGSGRVTEFGKSSLSVEGTTAAPRAKPVGVETVGGPYLVYREDGKVVRLGDPSVVLSLGGRIGDPVASRDGTLWLPRTSAGYLCRLARDARRAACPVALPRGHSGALSVVGGRLVFVDKTTDRLHVVAKDGLGEGHELGVDVRDDARLASTDVDGRVAILDGKHMHLVDAGLGGTSKAAKPVTVDLGEGEFVGPVSTGAVVAVVNSTTGTLTVYDSEGQSKDSKELPREKGEPRLTRGEDDRIYVDGAEGEHVVVVDTDGDLTDVPIKDRGGADEAPQPKPGAEGPPNNSGHESPPSPPDTPAPPRVPATPPGAPANVTATAGNAAATVNWGPAPDNRSPITRYRITWPGGSTIAGPAQRTATIPGLANGTTYVFTVTAVNALGTGPGVAANAVTPGPPARPASPPTNVTVDYDPGTRTAVLNWAPPADYGGGAPGGYYVTGTGWGESSVGGTTWTFDNIQAGGTLTFTVRARTTDGAGQLIEGQDAVVTADAGPPPGTGSVNLSRGEATEEHCGENDDCAWMHVELVGLQPNTWYDVTPYSSDPTYGNEGGSYQTDENGNFSTEQFAYTGIGDTVWVIAVSQDDGSSVRSNDLVWEAG